jgi:hypothetical protein
VDLQEGRLSSSSPLREVMDLEPSLPDDVLVGVLVG